MTILLGADRYRPLHQSWYETRDSNAIGVVDPEFGTVACATIPPRNVRTRYPFSELSEDCIGTSDLGFEPVPGIL